MRNWRTAPTTTLFSTLVMCTAPATCPQIITESLMFLRYKAAKGAPLVVGAERSTTQRCRLDSVPELVACAADVGRMMCRSSCFEIVILVAWEKDGVRMPVPLRSMPSCCSSSSTPCNEASRCAFSSRGESLSSGVGENEELVIEVSEAWKGGAASRCDFASSAASFMDIAEAFLRVLNANFLGGLKVLRVFCSFSESALIACGAQIYVHLKVMCADCSYLGICALVVRWNVT